MGASSPLSFVFVGSVHLFVPSSLRIGTAAFIFAPGWPRIGAELLLLHACISVVSGRTSPVISHPHLRSSILLGVAEASLLLIVVGRHWS